MTAVAKWRKQSGMPHEGRPADSRPAADSVSAGPSSGASEGPETKQGGLTLRPVVDSTLDADAAWLRASVEAFEPRLRELEQRDREAAGPGAWSTRPDLGCGWGCRCCGSHIGSRSFLDLDRWWDRPWWDPRGPGRRREGALRQRLARAAAAGEPVVLGAAADPWAGDAPRRSRTRRLLEAFRGLEGAELAVTTASPLVLCDLDLLVELDRTSSLSVEMVVPAADPSLAHRLEPGSAGPAERLGALAEVAAQGIASRLRVAPLMPGLNDGEAALRPLVEAAARAGAVDVAASPLRLPFRPGSCRRPFLAWLAAQEPELFPRYRRLYRFRATLPPAHRENLLAILDHLRLTHGFPRGIPGRG